MTPPPLPAFLSQFNWTSFSGHRFFEGFCRPLHTAQLGAIETKAYSATEEPRGDHGRAEEIVMMILATPCLTDFVSTRAHTQSPKRLFWRAVDTADQPVHWKSRFLEASSLATGMRLPECAA
jgi:hypothetical protein